MPNRNFWNQNASRTEYDHRARDVRLRLEHNERLLAKRNAAERLWYFRLLLCPLGSIAGGSRRTLATNDRRPRHIGTPWPASVFIK